MDAVKIAHLETLLRLPGATAPVHDASVLSCGCLVSESQFRGTCPVCAETAHLLKPVQPLRELAQLIKQSESAKRAPLRNRPSETKEAIDLVDLFCKMAKEERTEPAEVISAHSQHTKESASAIERHIERQTTRGLAPLHYERLLLRLDEKLEYNFSKCFPFHRKHSAFQTQQKLRFSKLSLKLQSARFSGMAISTMHDPDVGERTLFALITSKKWEIHQFVSGQRSLVACGRLTGEYGRLFASLSPPRSSGLVLRNDFSGSKPDDEESLHTKLQLWAQISCCLSEKYLVVAGTRGVVRVLNVDPLAGDVGAPVYTYLTNFPIRCVAISPNSRLVACGITAKERMSGKQQPFIVVHHISGQNVSPITITVPFRDPLKLLAFNHLSTHLLCCTVYEMRYFIIRLRSEGSDSYKRPRLIWSDTRVDRQRGSDTSDGVSDVLRDEDDMMDDEGITDAGFGVPFSNTLVLTTLTLKTRPSVVLKLNGPTIDSQTKSAVSYDLALLISGHSAQETEVAGTISDVEVVMKVPEIGSAIHRAELSPRGDGMVFVDKLGRLYLVCSPSMKQQLLQRKIVVLLGEAASAVRSTEAAVVRFSTDGGKVFVVDRKGLFQVFDFTKGAPGDSEVIKCKIISV